MTTTTTITTMTILSEDESGAFAGHGHPHNGYYAGDFGHRNGRSTTRSTSAHRTLPRVVLPRR